MGKRVVWWGFPGGQLLRYYNIFLGVFTFRGSWLRRGVEFIGRGGKWNENTSARV
jgi:hypothetical protein